MSQSSNRRGASLIQQPPRLLIFGAHPDDAEFHAGGLAARYRSLGQTVRMVSVTNGEAGHQELSGPVLAALRRQEAARAAAVIGAESVVWDFPDGQLEPTLEVRRRIIREIRTFAPDLVLTHRPNDYHPDHRAVGQAVQDACYLVTVPAIVPDVPILARDPVVACMPDLFTRPVPLRADVVVDTAPEIDTVIRMLACHASQFFQWLPYNKGILQQVPAEDAGRLEWLRAWYVDWLRQVAERHRAEIVRTYGADRGDAMELVEVYEVSEYGTPLDGPRRRHLFPFVPA